jgi:hypothetical protein
MATQAEVAAALAYFDACDDLELLMEVLRGIRPRAAAAVRRYETRNVDAPGPDPVAAAAMPATRDAALRTVRQTEDFAQLQALSRAIGRRIETLRPS